MTNPSRQERSILPIRACGRSLRFTQWGRPRFWTIPAEKFALAGLSLGGMLAVEIMQFAAHRVSRLALLDTGMRGQNESERAIRRARIRLADQGHFELVLGLQMARFYEGLGLELADLIKEQILLALPMQRICREECKGICPVCGANRNEVPCECHVKPADDRWIALKNL